MRPFVYLAAVAALVWAGSVAAGDKEQFVEFEARGTTHTFDLTTVDLLQPGKLSIRYTTIDSPEIIRVRLAIFDALKDACSKPAGKYPVPEAILRLKKPDMPSKEIEVDVTKGIKVAEWERPYREDTLAPGVQSAEMLVCNPKGRKLDDQYHERRQSVMNGIKGKIMFDCRRALMGIYRDEDDAEPMVVAVRGDLNSLFYFDICWKVTGQQPYWP